MTVLSCTKCGTDQELNIDRSTYVVRCTDCGTDFKIPRKFRKNKAELKEYKSRVNIRIGIRYRGDVLDVGWTVQSAEKGNQFMEMTSVRVDVRNHPEKLHWYIAVFKCLQNINDYKEARIWVKDKQVLDHLSGEIELPENDLRESMKNRIIDLASKKFYGCEFFEADNVGRDIQRMIN